MTPEMSSSRRFEEETGFIESKTVKKQLFHDPSAAEAAAGGITGGSSGHFRSSMATPEVSYDSSVHGFRLSSNQNRFCIGFGNLETESTQTGRDFVGLHDNLGVSEVDCSQNGMTMVKITPLDTCGFAVDCGIADIPPADGTRIAARAVAHQGIFENAFSNESTASKPDPLTCKPM
jgi:hypothetical protein